MYKPKIEGSNPATDTGSEEITKTGQFTFFSLVTQWYNTTHEPKIKCLNPATDTRSKKMRKSRVFTWL